MPEDIKQSEDLIDVGETVGADINLDDKGEPEKVEAPAKWGSYNINSSLKKVVFSCTGMLLQDFCFLSFLIFIINL